MCRCGYLEICLSQPLLFSVLDAEPKNTLIFWKDMPLEAFRGFIALRKIDFFFMSIVHDTAKFPEDCFQGFHSTIIYL